LLESLFDDTVISPFYAEEASSFGTVGAANKSRQRDAIDKLIACHPIALGVTLVTNNEAAFRDYPGFRIETWARGH